MRIEKLLLRVMLLVVAVTSGLSLTAAGSSIEGEPSPLVVKAVPPAYPAIARAAHATGEVAIEATIDAQGAVTSVSIIKGHKLLNDAAEKAARRWKFSPLERGLNARKARLEFQFTLIAANKGTPDDLGVVFWPPFKVEVIDTAYRVD